MGYRTLTPAYTLQALLEGFNEMLSKLERLRKAVAMPGSDGRQVAIYGMQSVFLGFGLTVHAITGAGLRSRDRTKAEVRESLTNYATVAGKTNDQLLTCIDFVWRLGLLTLFHFKLDSLFQNLLRAFGKVPGKAGFAVNSKNLLRRITLTNPQCAAETLKAITLLRNTLHNNGIHRGQDWGPFEAHGLTYEFTKDHDVKCASFAHVLVILDSTIDVLEQVLLSAQVKNLPTVEDRYVFLNP